MIKTVKKNKRYTKSCTNLGVSTKSVPAMTLRAESFAFVEAVKFRDVSPDNADKSAIFIFDLSVRAFGRFRLISSVLLAFLSFEKVFLSSKLPQGII